MLSVDPASAGELTRTPLFDLPVYLDDPHLLVVGKPAGLLPHRTHPRPQMSLHELVRREWWQDETLELAHRLDRETSGLLIIGRTRAAIRHLAGQFEARTVSKQYLAIVEGRVADDSGRIEVAIGRALGGAVNKKQAVDGERARPCVTDYRVIERRGEFSLLEVAPQTGRSHQIRVHLQWLGHPLVGDKLYGPDERWHLRFRASGWTRAMAESLRLPRHALHASGLALDHPHTGQRLTVVSPMPTDMAHFWEAQAG